MRLQYWKTPLAGLIAAFSLPLLAGEKPASWKMLEPAFSGHRLVAPALSGEIPPSALYRKAAYARAWEMRARLPVVDLEQFAGGLTPRRRGKHESSNLRLDGENGIRFKFRGFKDNLPKDAPEIPAVPFLQDLLQGRYAMSFPYGAEVAASLADAAGVYHTFPRICVLPDSPALDRYREDFALVPGCLEVHPANIEAVHTLYGNAYRILKTRKFLETLLKNPIERVDTERLFQARFLDALLADWDRHEGQWKWVQASKHAPWAPIALDRDMAFFDMRGTPGELALDARVDWERSRFRGEFFSFGKRILNPAGLMERGAFLDRRFLASRSREEWIKAARAFQKSMHDTALENAVNTLPEPIFAAFGETLLKTLKTRREAMERFALEYHRYLNRTGTGPRDR
jgi:hypothetical protein